MLHDASAFDELTHGLSKDYSPLDLSLYPTLESQPDVLADRVELFNQACVRTAVAIMLMLLVGIALTLLGAR